jgi:hypothetical protein
MKDKGRRNILGRITTSEGQAPKNIQVSSENLREHAERVNAAFRPGPEHRIRKD